MTTPFHDLSDFIALRRVTGLSLSPDGERLIAGVAELDDKRAKRPTSLWELPRGPGEGRPVRLTRGLEGETLLGFTAAGDLLFASKRETGEDDDAARLWLLPRGGGESLEVARLHGGFDGIACDRAGGRVWFLSATNPAADGDLERDAELAKRRKESKTTGILHSGFPVRAWDHDLDGTRPQLFVADAEGLESDRLEPRQLTSIPAGERLHGFDLDDSGRVVIGIIARPTTGIESATVIARIDPDTGSATTILEEEDWTFWSATVSPDGSFAVLTRSSVASDERPLESRLVKLDLATGEQTLLGGALDDMPGEVVITRDGRHVVTAMDDHGAGVLVAIPVDGGEAIRLTAERAHFDAVCVSPEWTPGSDAGLYALRDRIDTPPAPVRVGPDGATSLLPCPAEPVEVPGPLVEVETTAADGTPLRAWLCLPAGASAASPAPLAMFVHGGPWGSWNAWSWRWCPWTATARGYAVLLPDPAISTGYGQSMIARGWRRIGDAPFDDLMRLADAAVAREDIDQTRQAALGGSYGGYMANWIAGHTGDRFRCIVSHASLYDFDSFRGTTDAGAHWRRHLTDAHGEESSPHRWVGEITAPMLVIHGDKDYRVPIGQGLQLWSDLLAAQGRTADENRNRFLYFPDEHHWILGPQNSRLWYETVLAFLDEHVKGEEFRRPELV